MVEGLDQGVEQTRQCEMGRAAPSELVDVDTSDIGCIAVPSRCTRLLHAFPGIN